MARDQYDAPPETLHELFDRAHIEFREFPTAGKQHGGARSKLLCPQCQGGREHEKNFFVLIDRDGFGATWHCFRANNCGFSGGGRLKDAPERPQRAPKHYRKPRPEPRPELPDTLVEYYKGFAISKDTLEALGIYRTSRRMPVLDRDGKEIKNATQVRPVIAYPYVCDGELVNVKYKAIYDKGRKRFMQEANARPTLFNIDSFTNFGPNDWGIIVEGEDDVAALYECGWHQTTTLANGSPDKISPTFDKENDDDRRYEALYGEPRIEKLAVIILAGDMDPAGIRHHEEITRRVGKGRCRVVRWPEGCKDAKDTLKQRGVEAVNHAIQSAALYPLEGVHPLDDETILRLHRGEYDMRIVTGVGIIDSLFCLNDAGSLIVTTGISGRGKTTFWNAMATMYVEQNEAFMREDRLLQPFHTIVCSPELNVAEITSSLVAQRARRPFHPHPMVERVSEAELTTDYLPWVRRHFTFVDWPDRGTQPTISWAYDRFEENIIRTSAKLAIMDPWQEFDDEIPRSWRSTPSKWVGRCIQRFIGLAEKTRCNIILVTHPAKMRKLSGEQSEQVPDGEDIAESAHFKSRCHIGLTVHRPKTDEDAMSVIVWKVRNGRFARYGKVDLRYDRNTTRIFPRPVPLGEEIDVPHRYWQDTH